MPSRHDAATSSGSVAHYRGCCLLVAWLRVVRSRRWGTASSPSMLAMAYLGPVGMVPDPRSSDLLTHRPVLVSIVLRTDTGGADQPRAGLWLPESCHQGGHSGQGTAGPGWPLLHMLRVIPPGGSKPALPLPCTAQLLPL